MKRLILFFVLLMSLQAFGQMHYAEIVTESLPYWEVAGIRISKSPNLDGWSICHFFKGAITYQCFIWLGAEPKYAIRGAVTLAVLYEVFHDGLGWPLPFGIDDEPDPKGLDIADICFDTLGVYCTRALNALLKLEKVR